MTNHLKPAAAVDPNTTSRAAAYALWLHAPNPMVTLVKTLDVTNLVRISRKKQLKFNMLLDYCIGAAASSIVEFYLLPVGEQFMQYDAIAVNTIIKNKNSVIQSCDVRFSTDLGSFNQEYLTSTAQAAEQCRDIDLSESCMVIGTSAITATEIDAAVGMNSGIYNNPFLIWGKYRKKRLRYTLPVSFQFHHTQMDGVHAGRFLESLQAEIKKLK